MHSCSVADPFCPGTSLINDMNVHVDRFFHDQLLAAYVYFGIPRLKVSSRPLFTNLKLELSKSLKKTFSLGSDGNQKFALIPVPSQELKSRLDKVFISSLNRHYFPSLDRFPQLFPKPVAAEALLMLLSRSCNRLSPRFAHLILPWVRSHHNLRIQIIYSGLLAAVLLMHQYNSINPISSI